MTTYHVAVRDIEGVSYPAVFNTLEAAREFAHSIPAGGRTVKIEVLADGDRPTHWTAQGSAMRIIETVSVS